MDHDPAAAQRRRRRAGGSPKPPRLDQIKGAAEVEGTFGMSAMTGDLFVFLNRRGTQVRILFWDRDGFCILMKKLEAGTFRRVKTQEGALRVEIDAGELAMLLEGIDAPKVRRRKRYVPPQNDDKGDGVRDPS